MQTKIYLLALASIVLTASFVSCSNGEGGKSVKSGAKVAGSMYSDSDEDTIHVVTDTAHVLDN